MNHEHETQRPKPKDGSTYMVPLSIVVAGALIAGAIYMSRSGSSPQAGTLPRAEEEIAIAQVTAEDHIRGNPEAPLVLVEYSDTDCPFCQRFHQTMARLMDEYGKNGQLAWVYRHYPIPQLHPNAPKEAEALECAAELGGNAKFWEYADELYKNPRTQTSEGHPELSVLAENLGLNKTEFANCLTSGRTKALVDADATNAEASGGQGTPHNVLVFKDEVPDAVKTYVNQLATQIGPGVVVVSKDEKKVRIGGALPYEMMKPLLDAALEG